MRKLKWYSVKTVYKIYAIGKPRFKDKDYKSDICLCEERVVLFRAYTVDNALKMGEKDAKYYCKDVYFNKYFQKIKTQYLGICEAFELFDKPNENVEVYSSNEIMEKRISKREVIIRKFGKDFASSEDRWRKNFYNADLRK